MKTIKLSLPLCLALAFVCAPALAAPVLGPELSGFAVLGSSTVTNTGQTTLTGDLGVSLGSAITGFFGTVANEGPGVFSGTAHQADATAGAAQAQLGLAMTSLGLMSGSTLGANLGGLTLTSGVYSFSSSAQLTGTLVLDGQGNANAFWVFNIPTTLTTASSSIVSLINTGKDAGVFWDVGSSATLGTNTSFEGNILANANITLNTGAFMGGGGAFARTGAVTMDNNTVSLGYFGGIEVAGLGEVATALPFTSVSSVPEPETLAMLLSGLGLLGFVVRRRNQKDAQFCM
jgi:type VI secretion system secreted protein VgrG